MNANLIIEAAIGHVLVDGFASVSFSEYEPLEMDL